MTFLLRQSDSMESLSCDPNVIFNFNNSHFFYSFDGFDFDAKLQIAEGWCMNTRVFEASTLLYNLPKLQPHNLIFMSFVNLVNISNHDRFI